jgi:hypothetical protein
LSSGGSPDPRQQPFGLGIALSDGLWIFEAESTHPFNYIIYYSITDVIGARATPENAYNAGKSSYFRY